MKLVRTTQRATIQTWSRANCFGFFPSTKAHITGSTGLKSWTMVFPGNWNKFSKDTTFLGSLQSFNMYIPNRREFTWIFLYSIYVNTNRYLKWYNRKICLWCKNHCRQYDLMAGHSLSNMAFRIDQSIFKTLLVSNKVWSYPGH